MKLMCATILALLLLMASCNDWSGTPVQTTYGKVIGKQYEPERFIGRGGTIPEQWYVAVTVHHTSVTLRTTEHFYNSVEKGTEVMVIYQYRNKHRSGSTTVEVNVLGLETKDGLPNLSH